MGSGEEPGAAGSSPHIHRSPSSIETGRVLDQAGSIALIHSIARCERSRWEQALKHLFEIVRGRTCSGFSMRRTPSLRATSVDQSRSPTVQKTRSFFVAWIPWSGERPQLNIRLLALSPRSMPSHSATTKR